MLLGERILLNDWLLKTFEDTRWDVVGLHKISYKRLILTPGGRGLPCERSGRPIWAGLELYLTPKRLPLKTELTAFFNSSSAALKDTWRLKVVAFRFQHFK